MIKQYGTLAGFLTAALALLAPAFAQADEGDPPSRVARLAFVQGSVSLQPGGTNDWIAAPLNRPLTNGDQLWSDQDSRVELQLDGSSLRLSSNTAVSFLNLGDNVTQIQLTAGSLLVRVRRLDENETYEIDTPNLAFSVLRPGLYRLNVDASGNTTAIRVRSGQGEVTGGGSAYSVNPNEYAIFSGTDELADAQSVIPQDDPFDTWSAGRDARWEHSPSARYVSADIVGYEDLDDQGNWGSTPDYGYVWFPRSVESGWAPYHNGHWSYVAPWGYTWVDDQPWGFAPFHYGRWIFVNGAWGWIPAPPRAAGAIYVRPVYAPALVAWVGVGANIAWFALGPREVFVPSYPVSRRYVNNINVSNTTVTRTVINNVYNTTIINNKTVNVTTVNYVNRRAPGAVAVTSSQAFASAQPVSRNIVEVDQRTLASAQIRTVAPAEVPTKQAVLGAARAVNIKPPAAVQARAIVARTLPPPPPPAFEKRQEAIKSNGGTPLSAAQVQSIQVNSVSRANVRIAPPATPVKAGQAPKPGPVLSAAPKTVPPPEPAPKAAVPPAPVANPEVRQSTVTAIHPKEAPPPVKPASPNDAITALERQHLQEQQQLQSRQEQQRQQVQQQQELEHAQLAKQNSDDAKKKQLEQQHQQQTQQLTEQHARAQQQLQAQQEEQRRQQEAQAQAQAQAKNKNKPPEHTPNPKPQS